MGALGAVPSHLALIYRARTRLDDSLDVVAAHGTGGATGAVLTGVFADPAWSGGPSGLLAGTPGQIAVQLYSVVVVLAYSGLATFAILKLVGLVLPLRTNGRVEGVGLDVAEHGEEAYTTGDGAILVSPNDAAAARRLSDVIALQPVRRSPSEGGNGGHL
jgi:Amt family ammonium transporter